MDILTIVNYYYKILAIYTRLIRGFFPTFGVIMIQLFPEYMNMSLVELVHYHVTPGLGYQETVDYYRGLPEYLLVQLLEVEPDRAFSTGQFSKTLLQEGLRRITEGELLESDLSANARGFIIYH